MKKHLLFSSGLAALLALNSNLKAQEIIPQGPAYQHGNYKYQDVLVPRISKIKVPVYSHNPIYEQTNKGMVLRGYEDRFIGWKEKTEVKWSRETLSSYSPLNTTNNTDSIFITPQQTPIEPYPADQPPIQNIPPQPPLQAPQSKNQKGLLEGIVTFPFEITGQTSRFLLDPRRPVETENEYWSRIRNQAEIRKLQRQQEKLRWQQYQLNQRQLELNQMQRGN